jgi:hypothetical protein
MTTLQNTLLSRGPFDVTFRELELSSESACGLTGSTPCSVAFFRAKYPQTPVKIGNYAYLIERAATGRGWRHGRVMRLIQFDITDPGGRSSSKRGRRR